MKNIFKNIIRIILKAEAKLVLWKYSPSIVAITGSVGKTSTKDAVYAVLSKFYHVRKSEKSYNSEIGLPLAILGLENGWDSPLIWIKNIFLGIWLFLWPHKYPKWLVLEVGVGKSGDIAKTASWLKTDVVIMTTIGETPVHIEFFKSRDHLVEEKSLLIKTLKKDGLLVLNRDDETIFEMKNKSKNRLVTYGFNEDSDVTASNQAIFYKKLEENKNEIPNGAIFRIDFGGNSLPVYLDGVFGKNHIYAALAALALSFGKKLNMLESVDYLKSYDFPAGRMRLLKGINETNIIDDSYNASPFAMESSLQTLGEIKNTGRKIAVIGDMLELGKHTIPAHKKIGEIAKENADILVLVGARTLSVKEGALEAGMREKQIFHFNDSLSAGGFVRDLIKPMDLILVKGSQGMRMERIVEILILEKNMKESLLVRQDKEWLKKK